MHFHLRMKISVRLYDIFIAFGWECEKQFHVFVITKTVQHLYRSKWVNRVQRKRENEWLYQTQSSRSLQRFLCHKNYVFRRASFCRTRTHAAKYSLTYFTDSTRQFHFQNSFINNLSHIVNLYMVTRFWVKTRKLTISNLPLMWFEAIKWIEEMTVLLRLAFSLSLSFSLKSIFLLTTRNQLKDCMIFGLMLSAMKFIVKREAIWTLYMNWNPSASVLSRLLQTNEIEFWHYTLFVTFCCTSLHCNTFSVCNHCRQWFCYSTQNAAVFCFIHLFSVQQQQSNRNRKRQIFGVLEQFVNKVSTRRENFYQIAFDNKENHLKAKRIE